MDYDPKIFPIGIFDGHIIPFGGKSQLHPNSRVVFIREDLNLYKRPMSVRPEVNDANMKPFGSHLKGWKPQHQPKPKKVATKKKKKKKTIEMESTLDVRSDILGLNQESESEIEARSDDLVSVAGSVTTEEELPFEEEKLPN
jgi:hypothetical protein